MLARRSGDVGNGRKTCLVVNGYDATLNNLMVWSPTSSLILTCSKDLDAALVG